MSLTGTIRGNRIELDDPPPFADGTRVTVNVATVRPAVFPRRGSPAAILKLAGTLTHEEAEAIRQAVESISHVDEDLWALGQ